MRKVSGAEPSPGTQPLFLANSRHSDISFLIPAKFLFLIARVYLIVLILFPLVGRGICGINSSPCAGYQDYLPASGLLTVLGCTRGKLGSKIHQYL